MEPGALVPAPDVIQVHWAWFDVLLIVTFVIHLLFMNTLLGSVLISFWDEWRGRKAGPARSEALSHAMPTTLALTVTFGVAPCFYSVLYGNLSTQSVLMAAYGVGVGLLIGPTTPFMFTASYITP
jgi:hypothetical protein